LISNKSLELFRYGRQILKEKGIILVDTKYEFGRLDNKIILIDEIHTCDSSRLWIENTYQHLFNNKEPEKIDKYIIRDWVKTQCNPYKENIPIIPKDLIDRTTDIYQYYYSLLSNSIDYITVAASSSFIQNLPSIIQNPQSVPGFFIGGSGSKEKQKIIIVMICLILLILDKKNKISGTGFEPM